jgi:hemolysin III
LRGPWGWSLLGAVWTLAVLGIVQEIWLARGERVLSLVIYVLMGWLALVAVVPLWQALTPAGFAWLAAGGACYTLGIAFYATDHKLRHGHGIWHLFVLAGSTCHFLTMALYVA